MYFKKFRLFYWLILLFNYIFLVYNVVERGCYLLYKIINLYLDMLVMIFCNNVYFLFYIFLMLDLFVNYMYL